MLQETWVLPRFGIWSGMAVAQGAWSPCEQPPVGALQPTLLLN